MQQAFITIFPMWGIIAFGYIIGKFNIISSNADEVFSRYVFYCAMPILLFLSLIERDIFASFNFDLIFTFAVSTLVCAIVALVISKKYLQLRKSMIPFFIMSTSYVNSINLGLPLSIIAFGNALPVVLINIFQLLIVSPILIAMMEKKGQQKSALDVIKKTVVSLLKHPIIIATIVGVICSELELAPIEVVNSTLKLIAQSAIPLALFALGLTLAKINLSEIKKFSGDIGSAIIIKLFIQPLVAGSIGYYVIGLEAKFLLPVILIAGLPSPQNVVIFAQKYELYVYQSAAIVFFTSIVSIGSISIIIFLSSGVL